MEKYFEDYFKTFQVYSSWAESRWKSKILYNFKTFQVYSSFFELDRIERLERLFQNFSSL